MEKYSTDWLASKSVFYNEQTCVVSDNINDVIDYNNIEFDPEGLNNYLDFGYSVFGQTPIKNVKFLSHSSELIIDDKKINVIKKNDPIEQYWDCKKSEEEVLNNLKDKIQNWEASVENEIIIPTSGGFDSRLLNFFIKDKQRIRSYTYGASKKQHDSFEVIYAKKLSEILKTNWQQIYLGDYHNYFDDWNSLYGVATHAHGMYQIEFYKKVYDVYKESRPVLSGIIGDAWAGSVNITSIDSMQAVKLLGYSHEMNSDAKYSKLKSTPELLNAYYKTNKELLMDERYKVIESMRFKIILLNYLLKVPNSVGFKTWSPYLDIEIALSMLNLNPHRRKGREWQKDFFKKNNIFLEDMKLKTSYRNQLNLFAIDRNKLKPLDIKILSEIIDIKYLEWINRKIINVYISKTVSYLLGVPKIGYVLNYVGLKDQVIKAYNAYLTLRPLETLLIKRNKG